MFFLLQGLILKASGHCVLTICLYDQIYFTFQQSLPLTIITMWWCNKSQSRPILVGCPSFSCHPGLVYHCPLILVTYRLVLIAFIFLSSSSLAGFLSTPHYFTHCRWDRTWTPSPVRAYTVCHTVETNKNAANTQPEVEGTLSS